MQHIVSQNDWLKARKALLAKEKDFTRQRDALSAERRKLPWVRIEKRYDFESLTGRETLRDLFAGKSQLIIYHFMLGPNWIHGCPSCSFLADHFDGAIQHLAQRDVTMLAVSRAPIAEIEAYRKRMGWSFKWVSSFGTDFNRDFGVSFSQDEMENGAVYNYAKGKIPAEELPGLSVFARNDAAEIFHTYSSYARGLDILIGTYNLLDLAPKGRDEDALPWSMAWVRRHDEYATAAPSCCHGVKD